jgi:hypothetical protein
MPTSVNILIVTDGDGAFDQTSQYRFGLTTLMDALTSDVQDGMSYVIKKAHRYPKNKYPQAAGADIDGFTFDANFNLANYDELWLFGIASSNPEGPYGDPVGFALQPDELAIIQQFMDGGGGVFATGDHDDLGRDLCGSIPRVRSMRRWEFDYTAAGTDYSGYDEGSNYSPPVKGKFRHSTIVKDANGQYEFDNQSDDIPQTINPVMTGLVSGSPYARQITSFPHPLLCGTDGVISVLPDHMHEGQCELPLSLTDTYSFLGKLLPEYPSLFGSPLSPQVVAWENIIGRSKMGPDDPGQSGGYDDNEDLASDAAACIAAWDGQLVDCGRVVVDSTFHHFVDVNFLGVGVDPTHNWAADEVAKKLGLANSTSVDGQAAFKHIRQYFRNIARWLAPPPKQLAFKVGWIRRAALDSRISKTIGTANGLLGKIHFGGGMFTVMRNFIPPCAVFEMSGVGVPNPLSVILGHWFILTTLPDPPPDLNWRELGVNVGVLSQFTLDTAGSAVNQVLRQRPTLPDAEVLPTINAAVGAGVEEFIKAEIEGFRTSRELAERLLTQVRSARQA